MKKKIFIGLITLICISGCTNPDGSFTMKCTNKKEKLESMESQTTVTYKFNKKQLATEYTSETTQKFKDNKTYKTYKKAQEDSIKNNTEKNVKFDLKSDDKNKTLIYIMMIKDVEKKATKKEDKEIIKASTILKTNEQSGLKCELTGISKNKIKGYRH